MFYGTVGHQQTMFEVQIGSRLKRIIQDGADLSPVLRMHPFNHDLERRFNRGVDSENSKRFLGPEQFSGRGVPAKASGLAQFLSLRQVGFTLPQRGFSPLACADIPDETSEAAPLTVRNFPERDLPERKLDSELRSILSPAAQFGACKM